MRRNVILLTVSLGLAFFLAHCQKSLDIPAAGKLADFPARLGNWRLAGESLFDAPTLKILRASDYLMRVYGDPFGRYIGLYVGYHNGGPDSGPIHSPRNCLPGAGWALLHSREMSLDTMAGPVRLIRALYAKEMTRVLYYYWYQVRGECLTDDFALKFKELSGVLLHRRRDAAFIRLDLPDLPDKQADILAEDFVSAAYPELRRLLPGE